MASCLLIVGFYFTTTNAFTLLKGYALYKWDKPDTAEIATTHKEKKAPPNDQLYDKRPKTGDLIGELYIPKLEATLPIYHGTDEDELEKGVGHYAGSVLPGEKDNSVLSGHRDTVFRKLGDVGEGDLLVTKTEAGTFTYKVRKVRIVDADDRTVIVPKPKATLTVTTCYPFSYIGSAPERYVLIADLLKSEMDN
ncbi:class D sortase [Peribacillus sp. NPDC097295]|uniref:class D sortase n=1 Tax=Peribacillus sp. NPDC097295 TaxID=3364402 RepID=UPI00382F1CA7